MENMILRSPRFPFVSSHVAAIGFRRESGALGAAVDGDTLQALLHAMAAARVGGHFWGKRPNLSESITRWAPLETSSDAMALVESLHGQADNLAVTLPACRWARTVAASLRQHGCHVLIGEFDPWHILAHVESVLIQKFDGEAAILAWAANRALVPLGDQVLVPADLLAAASRRLTSEATYRDPFRNGVAISPMQAVEILAFWRAEFDRNLSISSAWAIAPWKRRNFRQMLWNGVEPLQFRRSYDAAAALAKASNGDVVGWAAKMGKEASAQSEPNRIRIAFAEDGFIRSAGLGSDCVPPQSIVVDFKRPHYDPTGPSDLEVMIEAGNAASDTLTLSRTLIDRIIRSGLGKYGSEVARDGGAIAPTDRRTILVVGQVENDASVIFGGAGVAGNLDLLKRARALEPEGFMIYRPHPDVEARHRKGAIPDREVLAVADCVNRDTPLNQLFDISDAVHVITSLAGFEALLRKKAVVTHGVPFYSGWGLTRDLGPPNPRRNRRVTLEELFAFAVLCYPRYLDPHTMLPCPAHVLVDRLIENQGKSASALTRFRRLRRLPLLRQMFGK